MRKIDSPFRLQAASRIVHHNVLQIDSTGLNAEHSLNGGKHSRIALCRRPRKCAGKIEPAQLNILSAEFSIPLQRAHQILPADSVRGQGKRSRSGSVHAAIEKRNRRCQLRKIHTIETTLEFIRWIGEQLRV